MKALLVAAVVFPVLFLILLVIPIVGGQDDVNALSCGATSGGPGAATAAAGSGCCTAGPSAATATPSAQPAAADQGAQAQDRTPASIPGFSAQQVRDAQAVVAAGKTLNVPPRGIAIALMTAYGESKLADITYGDAAGADSRGIFQQRSSGAWGSLSDRMNPLTASADFYRALLNVSGWEGMEPTLAAHAVQANADPNYYAQYWPIGVQLYGALQGTSAAALANPTLVACQTPMGASNVSFTPSGVAYVGQFPPDQLIARAHAYVNAGGFDPYFQTVDGSWARRCQAFVANLSGRPASGFDTAADGWAHALAIAAAHPASAKDGQSPPVGAWLYFRSPTSPAGHVTVYLGQGMSASTDLPTEGRVGIVPATDPITKWNQTYLGWVAPWGAPNSGSNGG